MNDSHCFAQYFLVAIDISRATFQKLVYKVVNTQLSMQLRILSVFIHLLYKVPFLDMAAVTRASQQSSQDNKAS